LGQDRQGRSRWKADGDVVKADAFISRLEKVKRTGNGTWLACCPAHEDRSPSMSVRELDDGRILVHCFAGCSVESILYAVGLDFDALFPDKPIEYAKPLRRSFPAADVLEAVAFECLVVMTTAYWIAEGKEVTKEDRDRALICYQRIEEARRLALG